MYSMLARQAIEKVLQETKFKKVKQFIRNCISQYCTCAVQCQNSETIKNISSRLSMIFPEKYMYSFLLRKRKYI